MARYLVLASPQAALARSAQEATRRGCAGDTSYWWATIAHPTNGQGAVCIDDAGDYGDAGLADDERAVLVPMAQMDPAWFPAEGE